MLYRGSEIMREVAWVVFDEIHYMRDKGRFGCLDCSGNQVDIHSSWGGLGGNNHTPS